MIFLFNRMTGEVFACDSEDIVELRTMVGSCRDLSKFETINGFGRFVRLRPLAEGHMDLTLVPRDGII